MEDSLKKMLDLGVGMLSYSREKLTETAKVWAEERKMTPAQTRTLIQEMVERGERGREEIQHAVQDQVQKTLQRLGIREDAEELKRELEQLRARVSELEGKIEVLEARSRTDA